MSGRRSSVGAPLRASTPVASALIVLASCATPPDPVGDIEVRDGEHALELLLEGNARFVACRPRHGHESLMRRARLEGGQHPFGIVLGCADSRVPPELVFDVGLGDLFVIRVAGNVVGVDESGSIEYAITHLGTPLVMVLGHESCGAVTAALAAVEDEPEELRHLLGTIAPGLSGIAPSLPHEQRVQLGVEANVRQSQRQLAAIQEREDLPASERALIVGAVYELETGRVRVLDRE